MTTSGPRLGATDEAVLAARRQLLSNLLGRVDELAAHAVAAILAEIPAYAAASHDDTLARDVEEQVREHYRTNLTALREGRNVTLAETTFGRDAATRRARAGFALHDYLKAFRVGHRVLWEAILDAAARTPAGLEAALPLAEPLMSYTEITSAHAGQAYVEFWQYAVADADRERRDLLDGLLAAELPVHGPLAAVAHAYGIDRATPMAVAAAVASGDAQAGATRAARLAIARSALGVASPLVVVRHSEIVAVAALGQTADLTATCSALEAVEEGLRRDGVNLAVGLSTLAHGVADLPRAYAEARTALETVARSGGVAALPRLSPFEYLALRADDTALRLVDPRLRAFLAEDRRRGAVLIDTVRAFAEADLNLRATSARLGVHPNTTQYRLGRVRERAGKNPRRTRDLLDLLVAIALEERAEVAEVADLCRSNKEG